MSWVMFPLVGNAVGRLRLVSRAMYEQAVLAKRSENPPTQPLWNARRSEPALGETVQKAR
ncbi:hypothetical protein BN1708_000497 [Verticillium longisporum]|uniref:Uncharacterized protein n=1 Tax=Verticillium longisporum TaxID=100787 RepID=A0A0G4LD78_VERLO|nr:hypothetical protein BN1708_000497 [Verticillium longisporum]